MRIIWSGFWSASVLVSWACLISALPANAEMSSQPSDPLLGVEGKKGAWVYSSEFADRFGLPTADVGTLPGAILAMELRVTRLILDKDASHYQCQLHVYLDNKLPIYYPEGDAGSKETLQLGDRSILGKNSKPEDRRFLGEANAKYHLAAYFKATRDKHPSFGSTVPILRYRKFFLADIAYLVYSVSCGYIVDPKAYSFTLGVKKQGVSRKSHNQGRDYYQFEIPKVFVEKFYPIAEKAARLNNARLERRRQNSYYPE